MFLHGQTSAVIVAFELCFGISYSKCGVGWVCSTIWRGLILEKPFQCTYTVYVHVQVGILMIVTKNDVDIYFSQVTSNGNWMHILYQSRLQAKKVRKDT